MRQKPPLPYHSAIHACGTYVAARETFTATFTHLCRSSEAVSAALHGGTRRPNALSHACQSMRTQEERLTAVSWGATSQGLYFITRYILSVLDFITSVRETTPVHFSPDFLLASSSNLFFFFKLHWHFLRRKRGSALQINCHLTCSFSFSISGPS